MSTATQQVAYQKRLDRIAGEIHFNLDRYGKAGADTRTVCGRHAVAIVTQARTCRIIRFDTNGVVIALGKGE
jgi:hypothetical protein